MVVNADLSIPLSYLCVEDIERSLRLVILWQIYQHNQYKIVGLSWAKYPD